MSNLIAKFPAACDSVIEVLNMEPLGGSETPAAPTVHTLQLSGLITGGGGKVLVRCRMTFSQGSGVTLELVQEHSVGYHHIPSLFPSQV